VHRRTAALAALAAFVLLGPAAAALAAGPSYVSAGGAGVLARDGRTRYVAVTTDDQTAIERVRVADGSVESWAVLDGQWGIPQPTISPSGGEGLSRDGRRLVVGNFGMTSPSEFAVVETGPMRVVDRFSLAGSFAYDALSPDASTVYLIQHVDASNADRYVVRAYDLRSHGLRPGRIADRTQRGWVMVGSPVARATSADGRWIYTLYQRPGGYPFIHALDAVNGVAHCTGLPWHGDQSPLATVGLTLEHGGETLAIRLRSGRTWLTMDTTSWRLAHVHARSFPWSPLLAGVGATLALLAVAAAAVALRRRNRREAVPLAL
jgi:hypothetical protein